MKVREILELADAAKPNDIAESVKISWINDIEGRVFCELYKNASEDFIPLEGEDAELSVPDAYSGVYLLYLWAMTELAAGNYSGYTEIARVFDAEFTVYAKYVMRKR